jgi:hypothetical protein
VTGPTFMIKKWEPSCTYASGGHTSVWFGLALKLDGLAAEAQ